MDVRVHGKSFQVSAELREMADQKVTRAGRIFDDGSVERQRMVFVEQNNVLRHGCLPGTRAFLLRALSLIHHRLKKKGGNQEVGSK